MVNLNVGTIQWAVESREATCQGEKCVMSDKPVYTQTAR